MTSMRSCSVKCSVDTALCSLGCVVCMVSYRTKPIFDIYGGFGCIYDERAWSAASACVWIVDDRTKTKEEEGEKESGARATPAIDILLIDIGHTRSNSSSSTWDSSRRRQTLFPRRLVVVVGICMGY